jgi:hypothetical protein
MPDRHAERGANSPASGVVASAVLAPVDLG